MLYEGAAVSVAMVDRAIAELKFDNQQGSVNKFDLRTVRELGEALDALQAQSGLKGVLVTSGKGVFIVGADIEEFVPVFPQGGAAVRSLLQANNTNLNRLESLAVPVVVAINGFALGGGLEFCLACDCRVAVEDARVGLPETSLGLIPGWGGTVRLPRLIGAEAALQWITVGKPRKAADALRDGVVDDVVAGNELCNTALQMLQQCIDAKIDVQALRRTKLDPLPAAASLAGVFNAAREVVEKNFGSDYPAPMAALKSIRDGAGLDRDAALEVEAACFAEVFDTDAARALVGVFLSDQLVVKKARSWAGRASGEVSRAAVLGAGIMGGGIAYQSAFTGTPIIMKDIAQEGLDLGIGEARKLLAKRVSRGQLSEAGMNGILDNIDPTLDFQGFAGVDMVVEAVVENPKIKHAVLREVEERVSAQCILASNTSTISITYLAEALQRPENFCGMHFFNPVHAMPLVEVIRGDKTSDAAIAKTVAYATSLRKKAIVVGDCPGFLVNRILFPYFAGFTGLLRDGADFQIVDQVMEKWGWPMGPAYLLDVVGMDTAYHCEEVLAQGFPERMSRSGKTGSEVMFDNQRYGQKNGKGFYEYQRDERGKPTKTVSRESYDLLASCCAPRRDFDEEEIIARCMLPMATEMARCLEEGIVDTPAEADMALIYGLGFPRFRGGVFRWMDALGWDTLLAYGKRYQALGKLYELTDSQRQMAADSRCYYPAAMPHPVDPQ